MVKQTVTHPDSGKLLGNEKQQITDTWNDTDGSWKHCGKWMKPNIK